MTITEIKKQPLGINEGIYIEEPLDILLFQDFKHVFEPSVGGAYARVFNIYSNDFKPSPKAIKVMRPIRNNDTNHREEKLKAFPEEIRALSAMQKVKRDWLTPMLEIGFIKFDQHIEELNELVDRNQTKLPDNTSAEKLTGVIERYPLEKNEILLSEIQSRIDDDWLPYIILEKQVSNNLYLLSAVERTRNILLKVDIAFDYAIQICEIMEKANEQKILYRDHKINHYYFNKNCGDGGHVVMIDWNCADGPKEESLRKEEIIKDVQQFIERSLSYLFTGKKAIGAMGPGPNFLDQIKSGTCLPDYSAFKGVNSNHLGKEEKNLFEKGLEGKFESFTELKESLQQVKNERK